METKTLPKEVRAYMAAIGSKGGKTTGITKARPREQMQRAAAIRWAKWRKEKNG